MAIFVPTTTSEGKDSAPRHDYDRDIVRKGAWDQRRGLHAVDARPQRAEFFSFWLGPFRWWLAETDHVPPANSHSFDPCKSVTRVPLVAVHSVQTLHPNHGESCAQP
jgi:hypothetical protein